MQRQIFSIFIVCSLLTLACSSSSEQGTEADVKQVHPDNQFAEGELINQKVDGYHGIWYYNQKIDNEYVYKYSGGLGTYPAKHKPFAVYRPEVNKTFFCYGGTDSTNSTLLHMVSYFDHETGMVPKPTLLLDKHTTDAHDNPVISIDDEGYIWIFSTSHGTSRPSYISRSKEPYNIDSFELIQVTKEEEEEVIPMTNFSYMQAWYLPEQGFINFFTKYNFPADRTLCFMTSEDGKSWSEWQRIAAIKKGHYQISATNGKVAGSAFNFHPDTEEKNGLNYRTNLYYVETPDFGKSWQTVDGQTLQLPLTEIENPALIHDYYNEDLNVYLKDIRYDEKGNPVILYLTSKGYEAGPANDPRTWKIAHWNDNEWLIHDITTSDNNYDMGSLYLEEDGTWRIIAPTETGPQPYNPGGEIAMWTSTDQGKSWKMVKQLTSSSERNHTYARRPVNAHPDFYAIWADGHGRQPSKSVLYFSDQEGNVFILPEQMDQDMMKPIPYTTGVAEGTVPEEKKQALGLK
ncbi:BNR-4 repeat-containing protein [Catalinimonas sp. 4WD22]|uniref:BNR-4 repeat-containing protein n=1 Tax=Catalinimonas locisalis TaxID=3133978 RepID=UPI0031014DD7